MSYVVIPKRSEESWFSAGVDVNSPNVSFPRRRASSVLSLPKQESIFLNDNNRATTCRTSSRLQPDGYVYAPTKPGLGYAIDWDKLDDMTVEIM